MAKRERDSAKRQTAKRERDSAKPQTMAAIPETGLPPFGFYKYCHS
jgi:hypothetical protein